MAYKRNVTVSPYVPDRAYAIGDNTKQANDLDNGKTVVMAADSTVSLSAAGDEVFGFITSLNPGTQDGHSIGSVLCDIGQEAFATDEAGGMAVGDVAVAGVQVAHGTAITTGKHANVKVGVLATDPGLNRWLVIETFGAAAGDKVLLRKV